MRYRYFVPLVVVFALGALFAYALLYVHPETVPSPLIGKAAPAFDVSTLDGTPARYTQADLTGQPRIINFFASWCVACKVEHPFLMDLARADHVSIIGVDYKDTDSAVRRDLDDHGNPYSLILLDPDGTMGLNWGVYGAPETFVLDAQGIIRYKHVGPLTPADWRDHVAPILEARS